jgi:hypothetical protein|tara:strand:+ start:372 stop:1190 length:819 start_codon:yes stop_codon:yes gene_type:complete
MAVDFSFLDDLFTDTDLPPVDIATYDPTDEFDLDYSYDPSNYGIGSFDVSNLFGDDDDFSYLFDDITDLTPSFTPGVDFSDVYADLFDEPADYEDTVRDLYPDLFMPSEEELIANAEQPGLLDTILGFFGADRKGGKRRAQGIMQGVTGGITDFANSPIGQLLLLNYLNEQRKDDIKVPIGAEAYGDQGLGSMPDYRVFNIQPALMPGVAYANAPPPEMKHGGVHGAGKDEGPGDITLARLEPGEFVMTRKATENLGARNLYNLMKQAERMG